MGNSQITFFLERDTHLEVNHYDYHTDEDNERNPFSVLRLDGTNLSIHGDRENFQRLAEFILSQVKRSDEAVQQALSEAGVA